MMRTGALVNRGFQAVMKQILTPFGDFHSGPIKRKERVVHKGNEYLLEGREWPGTTNVIDIVRCSLTSKNFQQCFDAYTAVFDYARAHPNVLQIARTKNMFTGKVKRADFQEQPYRDLKINVIYKQSMAKRSSPSSPQPTYKRRGEYNNRAERLEAYKFVREKSEYLKEDDSFHLGENVEAKTKGRGWQRATVQAVNTDDTYDVFFPDEKKRGRGWKTKNIRKRTTRMICEIQLILGDFLKYKQRTHHLYEVIRKETYWENNHLDPKQDEDKTE